MEKMKLKKKHQAFLDTLEKYEDLLIALDEMEISEVELNEWKREVIGFEELYLSIRDLTKLQERFLSMFRKKMCNVAATCRAVPIARSTFYVWSDKSDTFKKEAYYIKESLCDDIESIIYEKVFIQKDNTMIIWVSKAKMADRGYVDRYHNTNTNVNVAVDKYADKSLEEIEAEIAEMEANEQKRKNII